MTPLHPNPALDGRHLARITLDKADTFVAASLESLTITLHHLTLQGIFLFSFLERMTSRFLEDYECKQNPFGARVASATCGGFDGGGRQESFTDRETMSSPCLGSTDFSVYEEQFHARGVLLLEVDVAFVACFPSLRCYLSCHWFSYGLYV